MKEPDPAGLSNRPDTGLEYPVWCGLLDHFRGLADLFVVFLCMLLDGAFGPAAADKRYETKDKHNQQDRKNLLNHGLSPKDPRRRCCPRLTLS